MGLWTLRVQSKMLPYSALQNYSLVITCDGQVDSLVAVGQIDPIEFSRCHSFGTPPSEAKLAVDVVLFDFSTGDKYQGWAAGNTYRIHRVRDKFGNVVDPSDPTALTSGSLSDQYFMGINSICLMPGCYSTGIHVPNGTLAKNTRNQYGIPQCGALFMAPLRSSGEFCVKNMTQVELADSAAMIEYPTDACMSSCSADPDAIHLLTT